MGCVSTVCERMRSSMRYEIVSKCVPDVEVGFGVMGLEIRPPLSELAIQGLCQELTTEVQGDPYAISVSVTRNDAEGTALIYRQAKLKDGSFAEPYDVMCVVKNFIDPCRLYEIHETNVD